MARLESAGKLVRSVEGLPGGEEMRALKAARLGLTRPELAKLIAYAKIDLFDELMASQAPDDPAFEAPLTAYFPPQLKKYEDAMKRHRLRRAIVATYLADDLVNTGGPTFVDRVRETARAEPVAVACAFEAARRIFALDALADRINALDNKAPAGVQTALHREIASALRRLVIYLVRHARIEARGIDAVVASYASAVGAQRGLGLAGLTTLERTRAEAARDAFVAAGAPGDVALDAALLQPMTAALDVADLAERRRTPVAPTARLYRAVGAMFGFDALRAAAGSLTLDAHWDRLAMRRTIEALFDNQRALAELALAKIGDVSAVQTGEDAAAQAAAWAGGLDPAVAASRATIAQLEADGGWTFAKLTLAGAETHALVQAAGR